MYSGDYVVEKKKSRTSGKYLVLNFGVCVI